MVLVRFEYLRSAERKLLIGQLERPDMFENRPPLPTCRGGMFICSNLGQNLSDMDQYSHELIRSEANKLLPIILKPLISWIYCHSKTANKSQLYM